MEPYVEVVPTSVLGEGPHWVAGKQELIYVDIVGKYVRRLVPLTGEQTRVNIQTGETSLVVPVENTANQYIIAAGKAIELMEWDGRSTVPSSLTTLHTVEPDEPGNFWNDGKCDAQGRLWAGTWSPNNTGQLYRITDTIQSVQTGIGTSNGIDWNEDYTLMYYIDTPTRKVDVFDFDQVEGTISNRRTIYDFETVGEAGSPDGMAIDSDGNLWVACWGGSQVIHLNPTTGEKIGSISFPTSNMTSVGFGGTNLDVMYVTSAKDGLTEQEKLEQPAAGALFTVTNTGVRGMRIGNNFKFA